MTSGIVVVDKPPDWTSHDVVGRLRRLAGTRKVGHAGTLDPMATGVLVVGINKATRLLGHLMLGEKEYEATIRLGQSTITDDREGEVIETVDASHIDAAHIGAAVHQFIGEIDQIPSSVSAIKVGGKRSYARVRAGEDVQLAARTINVEKFVVEAVRSADTFIDVDVRVVCSSGTYIRALARDLGRGLEVGGHLRSLRRMKVGDFGLDRARTLEQLATRWELIDIDQAARLTFESVEVNEVQAVDIGYGRALPDLRIDASGPVAVFGPDGKFLALYKSSTIGAKPVAVFATLNAS